MLRHAVPVVVEPGQSVRGFLISCRTDCGSLSYQVDGSSKSLGWISHRISSPGVIGIKIDPAGEVKEIEA